MRRQGSAVRAGLLPGLLALAVTGFALLVVLVHGDWGPLRHTDQAVADGLNEAVSGHDVVVQVLRVVTGFGGSPMLAWVTSVGVAWLLLRRQARAALYVAVTAVGAWILISVVKLLVGRLRPVVHEPLAAPSGLSFPSGHALSTLVSYGVLLIVFLPATSRATRRFLISATVLLTLLVGLTRIALGVHYVSDVIAGWLLGAVWLAVTAVAFRHWPPDRLLGRSVPHALRPEAAERGPRPPAVLPALATGPGLRPVPRAHARAVTHPGHAAAELLVAWTLIVGGLYGLGVLVDGAGPGGRPAGWDRAVIRALVDLRTPWMNHLAEGLRVLGGAPGITAAVAVVGPLAVAATHSWRPFALLGLALVGQLTLFLVISVLVSRRRPEVPHLTSELPPTASFPSGHVSATLALTSCVAIIVFRATGRWWWRAVAVALAVLVTAAVAVERMYAGAHHPSDVASALLLAGLWTSACWWVTRPPAGAEAAERATRGASPSPVDG